MIIDNIRYNFYAYICVCVKGYLGVILVRVEGTWDDTSWIIGRRHQHGDEGSGEAI